MKLVGQKTADRQTQSETYGSALYPEPSVFSPLYAALGILCLTAFPLYAMYLGIEFIAHEEGALKRKRLYGKEAVQAGFIIYFISAAVFYKGVCYASIFFDSVDIHSIKYFVSVLLFILLATLFFIGIV